MICDSEHPSVPGVRCQTDAGLFPRHAWHSSTEVPEPWPNLEAEAIEERRKSQPTKTKAQKLLGWARETDANAKAIEEQRQAGLPDFDGETYQREHDYVRLSGQSQAVFTLMSDGVWRTLEEVGEVLGYPAQSVSARLRDFRKTKFGAYRVERRARGSRDHGLFEYRLVIQAT